MRFVSIKSSAGSAALVLRRARDFLAGQVTRTGNAIRAHMAEFGMIITAKGSKRVADLAEGLDSLPEAARLPLRVPFDQLAGTRARIDRLTGGDRAGASQERCEPAAGIDPRQGTMPPGSA